MDITIHETFAPQREYALPTSALWNFAPGWVTAIELTVEETGRAKLE